jgi:hypothetical protein
VSIGSGIGFGLADTNGVSDTDPSRERPVYERNEQGKTFGSLSSAKFEVDAPDLIAAIGTNGRSGYVRSSDLMESKPKSIDEGDCPCFG